MVLTTTKSESTRILNISQLAASMSNYRPPCKSVADYFDQVVKIGEKYDVSRVFLATDDESVVQHMRAVYADVC